MTHTRKEKRVRNLLR